jgi:hypothetical protein
MQIVTVNRTGRTDPLPTHVLDYTNCQTVLLQVVDLFVCDLVICSLQQGKSPAVLITDTHLQLGIQQAPQLSC